MFHVEQRVNMLTMFHVEHSLTAVVAQIIVVPRGTCGIAFCRIYSNPYFSAYLSLDG
jgi:hypothetical protein